MLGLSEVGIELDPWACATRRAAGHRVIRADVATYPPDHLFGRIEGLIASPPCQDWSIAGGGAGRAGESGHLVDTVPAWVVATRPTWVACELVPPALPVWREHAALYRALGYHTWCGLLEAADYGVPQNRERAILLASRAGPVSPPAPTHAEHPATLFGQLHPWVSLAQALDVPAFVRSRADGSVLDSARPAPTVCGHRRPAWTSYGVIRTGANTQLADGHRERYEKSTAEPAPTVDSKAGRTWWVHFTEGGPLKIDTADTLTLQSFRPGYPVQGNKTKRQEQIGNAIPPLLAAHIIAAVTGQVIEAAA